MPWRPGPKTPWPMGHHDSPQLIVMSHLVNEVGQKKVEPPGK